MTTETLTIIVEEDLLDISTNEKGITLIQNIGITGPAGPSVWGPITGTLSNQTDLQSALNAKQNTLVSGTNIKTLNGTSILGSGDLVISGGGSPTWGSITGTLSNQTDLQSALNAKLDDSQATSAGLDLLGATLSNQKIILSIPDSMDDLAGVISDIQHGSRSGGALHADATTSVSGFMSNTDKTKIDSVQSGATANSSDATLLTRANHTGTQLAATISDIQTTISNNAAVTANTAKVTNATHTGDATGATALTLATVNSNVGSFGTATAVPVQTVNGKGLTTALSNVAIAIPSNQVTDFTEAAQDATGAMIDTSLVYNDTTPLLSRAALTGHIVASAGSNATTLGSFTIAQLNTAVSDADVSVTSHTHLLAAGATDVTVTAANLNILDDGLNTTLHFHDSDRARANHTGTQLAATISDFSSAADARVVAGITGKQNTLVSGTNIRTINGNTLLGSTDLVISGGGSSVNIIGVVPSSDQSDWAPSGFSTGTTIIKLQPTTNSFISGLVGGTTDQDVTMINDSAFVVMIIEEDASSTAANRFKRDTGSYVILPQESIRFIYNATLSRWLKLNISRDLFEVGTRTQLTLPNTTTTVSNTGLHSVATTATISNLLSTATPTDDFQEYTAFQVSNSTASASADVRSSSAWALRGATTNRQGFLHTGRVRFTALGATGAVYAGLINSTAAITGQPSAIINCLLLGAQSGQTTLRIFFASASLGTPIDLGANFPVPSATAAYEYVFYSNGGGTQVEYMVRRLDTRQVAQGSLTTTLPVNTAGLGHRLAAAVGLTAAANTAQANYLLTVGL